MKRTIIFAVLALVIVGGALIVAQTRLTGFNKLLTVPADITAPEIFEPVATTAIATTTAAGDVPDISVTRIDPLREQADEILTRRVRVNAVGLPDAVRKDLERQIVEATAVLKQDYNNLAPWIALGLARKAFEDYEGAMEAWEFASVIRPQNSLSFANLGFLYGSYLKDYVRAEKNYLRAIANDVHDVSAYNNLVDLYWYSIPEKRVNIPKLLVGGLNENTDKEHRAPLLARLALYYRDNKEYAKAVDVMEEIVVLLPEHAGALRVEIDELKAKTN